MPTVGKARKKCNITLFLFGKPAWEMNLENEVVDEEMAHALATLGDELNERLQYLSGLTGKLLEKGWTGEGGLHDISYHKEQSVEQTEMELTEMGVDPRGMDFQEEEWPADAPIRENERHSEPPFKKAPGHSEDLQKQ